jgi:hypothetical protein
LTGATIRLMDMIGHGRNDAMIQIIMMVCKLAQPEVCEEQHIQFVFEGSLQQCTFTAQVYIAQWAGEHPQWTVKKFHCAYPRGDDRADSDPQSR